MREIFSVADYFVICTAGSGPQARAIADEIEGQLKEKGYPQLGIEGREDGSWILLDYGGVVVHIFLPEKREYYQLEMLWGDASELRWARKKAPSTSKARSTRKKTKRQ